jgi:NitT/TauT family transport system permease protein
VTAGRPPGPASFHLPPWNAFPETGRSLLRDAPIVVAAFALIYGLLSVAHDWSAPVNTHVTIQLDPRALPTYALFSVARIAIAYVLSLIVALAYGSLAAHSRAAERVLIPLLDTLQSIPVLSFLPGVMVAMVALFPARQLGLELGSILLIFTGQVWNMAFSVYSTTKMIPRDLLEAAQAFHLSWWQRFVQLELPYAAISLIWNSMMSVAGGWFFLMACEMFVLGSRDLRLPGLGSYLQTAANAGDIRAIIWGVAVMIAVIVLIDQVIWRPVIAWSEKFKFEQVEAVEAARSPVLTLLRRSPLVQRLLQTAVAPIGEALTLHFATSISVGNDVNRRPARLRRIRRWAGRILAAAGVAGIAYAVVRIGAVLLTLSRSQAGVLVYGAGATFLRVELTLVLAGLWTIPAGIYVGLRPRLAAIVQPIVQIAASVPATAVFPIIVLFLIGLGGGLGTGSIVLLLLGTQWYILFNVMAGASAIPTDLREVCQVYGLGVAERWRRLLLPGIFPFMITGFVTASGGAWNASIVAEYFRFQGRTLSTVGLGAIISRATDQEDFPMLLGATVLMAAIVVTVNRLVWRPLYALAATRFALDS